MIGFVSFLFFASVNQVFAQTPVYVGISSFPTTYGSNTNFQTSAVQEVIDFMNWKHLNIYRIAFSNDTDMNTVKLCVQYYLTHCKYDLIIDYFHQYPAADMTSQDWNMSTDRALKLLSTFKSYQSRIWIEPFNERTNDAPIFSKDIQAFVTTIRSKGYACRIICQRWYTQEWSAFASIKDPLNKFWFGEHAYMSEQSLSWAEKKMSDAKQYGFKLLNTEIGADIKEYPAFDESEVDSVSNYLQWCKTQGIGTCVWMLHGCRNWYADSTASYANLGLVFPTASRK